jgi:hypothetical protein
MAMRARSNKVIEQPKPFTPGVTRAMVRQHAYELFRDKLPDHPLTLEDWVLAEDEIVTVSPLAQKVGAFRRRCAWG